MNAHFKKCGFLFCSSLYFNQALLLQQYQIKQVVEELKSRGASMKDVLVFKDYRGLIHFHVDDEVFWQD